MHTAPQAFLSTAPITGIIRLKVLTRMRWFAVAGQLGALLTAHYFFTIPTPFDLSLSLIGFSAFYNLFLTLRQKEYPLLKNTGATFQLAFDTVQLAALLHFTGGLSNPFIILLLAPMVVGATILAGRSVIILTCLGILSLTALFAFSAPLPWPEGGVLPELFRVGEYIALLLSSLFLVFYVRKVARESRRLYEALGASRMELEREQKISAFGALAAAVAHELGSPLSTIAVISKELGRDLEKTNHRDDLQLLQEQVTRCRNILSDFAKHNVLTDKIFERVPLSAFLRAAAEPYQRNGKLFDITILKSEGVEPLWPLQPGLMHGVGNVIQNAFSYARGAVHCSLLWQGEEVVLIVRDDGPGFPPTLLPRLGQAYVSARPEKEAKSHMGLGLFIAKMLLERSGAKVDFANDAYSDGTVTGARVTLSWKHLPT